MLEQIIVFIGAAIGGTVLWKFGFGKGKKRRKKPSSKDYGTYLHSAHWQKTRTKKLKEQPCCEQCGSKNNLQIHHRYYRKNGHSILYREKMKDLQTLCKSCHTKVHQQWKHGPRS